MTTKIYQSVLAVFATMALIISCAHLQGTSPSKATEISRKEICFNPPPLSSAGKSAQCPYKEGLYLLPRSYPASSIFIGYSHNKEYGVFLREIIKVASMYNPPIKVNILITRHEVSVARTALSPLMQEPGGEHINVIPVPSDETLWAQDYMKVVTNLKTERSLILDLPYIEREGEVVPSSLSLTCRTDLIDQSAFFATSTPGNGDYGGNIQAMHGDLLVIGNNITSETSALLEKHLSHQETFPINVSWLETGHVDEVYSFTQSGPTNCPLNIQYASPTLAIELLDKNRSWDQLATYFQRDVYDDEDKDRQIFKVCFEAAGGQRSLKVCKELIKANQTYADIIYRDMLKLKKKVSEKTGCQEIQLTPLPVLYSPTNVAKEYGTVSDYATAINPNLVNNILLEKHVILPAQANPSFQKLTQEVFEKENLQPHFVESNLIHYGNGGLHCTSLVSRSCHQ